MSKVPLAVAVQLPDIIDPPDIVIVNAPVLPVIVPDTTIVPPLCPPTCIVPENALPVCVMDQVVPLVVDADDPLPIIEPLESEAFPTHVPDIVLEEPGFTGDDMVPPHATDVSAANTLKAVSNRIALLRSASAAVLPGIRHPRCITDARCKSCTAARLRVTSSQMQSSRDW